MHGSYRDHTSALTVSATLLVTAVNTIVFCTIYWRRLKKHWERAESRNQEWVGAESIRSESNGMQSVGCTHLWNHVSGILELSMRCKHLDKWECCLYSILKSPYNICLFCTLICILCSLYMKELIPAPNSSGMAVHVASLACVALHFWPKLSCGSCKTWVNTQCHVRRFPAAGHTCMQPKNAIWMLQAASNLSRRTSLWMCSL